MWVVPATGSIAGVVLLVRQPSHAWVIWLLVVMYALTMGSITVGFHRLFAHRSFTTTRIFQALLGIFGSMAFQGPLVYWVANHRRHHHYSDRDGDLHSPHAPSPRDTLAGFLHAHFFWSFGHELTNRVRYARDVYSDPVGRFVNRHYYVWVVLGFALPTVIGGVVERAWIGALMGALWGGCVRLLISNNTTAAINSISHMWGRRRFVSGDRSVNVTWLALPSFGEAWHNNHHRFPNSAIFGLRPGEVDLGAVIIRGLALLGWAKDINSPSPDAIRSAHEDFLSTQTGEPAPPPGASLG
jgi:stearoyl-CoA desaturase (delta-9 desaturase)